MQLEQHEKELAAIGAAIGCNCTPELRERLRTNLKEEEAAAQAHA